MNPTNNPSIGLTPRGPGRPTRQRALGLDPTELIARRDLLPWFWFAVAGVVTLVSAWDRHELVRHNKARERVVIIDPAGTYYLSPLMEFQEAKDLHIQQAELATLAFLERNPKDFDHAGLLKQLFLEPAHRKALDHQGRESAEFRAKSLHQKPEIARLDVLATRENEVLVHVTGQVIRTGVFQDRPFTEGLSFQLRLRLVRNPNMAANGRFPTAVAEFLYETTP